MIYFRIMQEQYKELLNVTELLLTSLRQSFNAQRKFATNLSYLSVHQPELNEEFSNNAEFQRLVLNNGELFIGNKRLMICISIVNIYEIIRM